MRRIRDRKFSMVGLLLEISGGREGKVNQARDIWDSRIAFIFVAFWISSPMLLKMSQRRKNMKKCVRRVKLKLLKVNWLREMNLEKETCLSSEVPNKNGDEK